MRPKGRKILKTDRKTKKIKDGQTKKKAGPRRLALAQPQKWYSSCAIPL